MRPPKLVCKKGEGDGGKEGREGGRESGREGSKKEIRMGTKKRDKNYFETIKKSRFQKSDEEKGTIKL